MADYNNNTDDVALDWGDSVKAGEGFHLLPAGTYFFNVTKMEKLRYAGSAKMPSCPQAKLTISCTNWDDPTENGPVITSLFLTQKQAWKIADFFKCLGDAEDAEGNVRPDWFNVVGRGGVLELGIREYEKRDGSKGEANEVTRWVMPEDAQKRIAKREAEERANAQQVTLGGRW